MLHRLAAHVRIVFLKSQRALAETYLDEGVDVSKDLGGGPEHVVHTKPERDHPEAGVAHAA